nr:hypothetical protein [Pandoravirus massiliensis]
METNIRHMPHDVILIIVSHADHATTRALRMASAQFHVVSVPNTAVTRVAHVAGRMKHNTLLHFAAAAAASFVPLDTPLPCLSIPQDLHGILALYRLFWLSRQPCTPLVRRAAAHAASLLGIGRGPCQCLCQVWDLLYLALASL